MKKSISLILSICMLISFIVPCSVMAAATSGKIYKHGSATEFAGTWTLEDGTLTISGSGALGGIEGSINYADVLKLVFTKDITSFSPNFDVFDNMKEIDVQSADLERLNEYFAYCDDLEIINITPDNKYMTAIDGVAYNKEVTEIMLYPKGKRDKVYTVPESTESVSILNDYVEEIVLHDSVTSVSLNCPALTELSITDSVTELYVEYHSNVAARENGLYYIGTDSNPYKFLVAADEAITEMNISNRTEIISGSFSFSKLKKIIIPDNVKKLNCTFWYCANLETIDIGSGVSYIPGFFCYGEMPKLREIIVSDNLKDVGQSPFWITGGMSDFDDTIIGGGSTSLPVPLWDELEPLEKDNPDNGYYFIGTENNPHLVLFYSGYSNEVINKNIVLPEGTKSLGTSLSIRNVETIEIPKSLMYIGENAFSLSADLTDVYYEGSKAEWEKIEICPNNDALLNANIHHRTKDFSRLTLSDETYTYSGAEKGLTVSGNLPSGSDVAYTYNGLPQKPTDAGTYNVTATVTKEGYNDLVLEAQMTIKPKTLTVSGLSAQTKEYDRTTDVTISGGTLSGVVSGDDVTAVIPERGTLASENVGSKIAVSMDDITLSGADKDNYILTQPTGLKATVTKRQITVSAKSYTIKQNSAVPTLEYEITKGSLLPGDTLTGALNVKADGTKIGTFDITKGTLSADSNYSMTFEKGKLTVVDKTPQNIVVSPIAEKVYGDAPFELIITPDENANLSAYTYASSNTDVAEISADGTITLKAAGETEITVAEPGNSNYAAFEQRQKLVVGKKSITITSVNLNEETAVLEGILTADTEVALDFDKLMIEVAGEAEGITANVIVSGFALIGEKSENYSVQTQSLESTVAMENIVSVSATADKGTVTGTGSYIKGSSVTVTASSNTGYKFSGWYVDGASVSSNTKYTFVADSDTALVAKFTKKSSGSGASISTPKPSTTPVPTTEPEQESDKDDSSTTVTDETTGTVTETTQNSDGSTSIVTEYVNGVKVSSRISSDGVTTAEITVPDSTVATEVTIPAKNPGNGTVAVIVNDDGTEDVIINSFAVENGVAVDISQNAKVMLIDKSKDFSDTKGHWASNYVDFVTARGLFNGTSEDEFSPDNNMTRGMLAVVLHNYESNPEYDYAGEFIDVEKDSWYGEAVGWLNSQGIATGYENGTFGAEANITREQLAVFLYRFSGSPEYKNNAGFVDNDKISGYAFDAISWASENAIISGKGENNCDPQGLATRAEVAAMLSRFVMNVR